MDRRPTELNHRSVEVCSSQPRPDRRLRFRHHLLCLLPPLRADPRPSWPLPAVDRHRSLAASCHLPGENPALPNVHAKWTAPNYVRVVEALVRRRQRSGRLEGLGGSAAVEKIFSSLEVRNPPSVLGSRLTFARSFRSSINPGGSCRASYRRPSRGDGEF